MRLSIQTLRHWSMTPIAIALVTTGLCMIILGQGTLAGRVALALQALV